MKKLRYGFMVSNMAYSPPSNAFLLDSQLVLGNIKCLLTLWDNGFYTNHSSLRPFTLWDFWLCHNSFVVKESGFVGFFVKRQEHRGPEPWAMQTVGSIPLPQSTAYRSKLLI